MATFVRTQTIEHEIGQRGRVEVRVTSSDARLRGVDGTQVRGHATFEIRAHDEADADRIFAAVRLEITHADGALLLHEPSGGVPETARASMQLELALPRDAELHFEGVSGDVVAEALGGRQQLQTVSGDLMLNDAGGELSLTTVSGDLTVRAEKGLSARANSVSGDLSLMAPQLASVAVNTVSGDVELEGAFAPDRRHSIDTVSGDLSIGLLGGATIEVRGVSTDISSRLPHQLLGRLSDRRVVIGDGRASIRFGSMSGDISIAPPRRTAPAQAQASSSVTNAPAEDPAMTVLRALERGEIDVEEAGRRLTEDARE